MSPAPSSAVLITAMCVGLFFSVLGFAAFPALMPVFFDEWGLDNTEAGWVNGLYFLGYLLAVPALVGATDRIDTTSASSWASCWFRIDVWLTAEFAVSCACCAVSIAVVAFSRAWPSTISIAADTTSAPTHSL